MPEAAATSCHHVIAAVLALTRGSLQVTSCPQTHAALWSPWSPLPMTETHAQGWRMLPQPGNLASGKGPKSSSASGVSMVLPIQMWLFLL